MTDSTPGPDDRNDAREAHVQVLTAEVRTLVVGSRQVTLSVYGQLDDVPSREIEAFGRVNPKGAPNGWIYVVGRHVDEGVLVRSAAPGSLTVVANGRPAYLSRVRDKYPSFSKIPRHYDSSPLRQATYAQGAADVAKELPAGSVERLLLLGEAQAAFGYADETFHRGRACDGSETCSPWADGAIACHRELLEEIPYDWEELPLIVLAGLR